MTYIIGDVHGHYNTLLALIEKLPKDANLIFVGDLVDRGLKSKEVIEFVRKNNYQCVLGNHEELMIHAAKNLIPKYKKGLDITYMNEMWLRNGGKQTLQSYDLIEIVDNKIVFKDNPEALEQFKNDITWLETLPLYIKLKHTKKNKPIVISHSNIGNVWHFHNDPNEQNLFREYAIWQRNDSKEDCEIFNIFGHTPVNDIELDQHYINIDTGCYINDMLYARLSCYCIEEDRVIWARRVANANI